MKKPAQKICVISVDFLPRLGGVSMMTHHLANALATNGAEVMAIGPKGSQIPPGLNAKYRLTVDQQSRPERRDHWDGIKEDGRIKNFIMSVHAEFPFERVLLMHPFYYGPAVASFCRAANVDLSVMFHGTELLSQLIARTRIRNIRSKLLRLGPSLLSRTREVATAADEILTNSNYTANIVRQLRTGTPIRPIGCGIDVTDYDRQLEPVPKYDLAKKHSLRKELGLPPEKLIVGTICRLVPSKNVDMLVRAVSQMPYAAGVVIGAGPESDKLKQLARDLRCQGRMHWFQDVSEERKWKLLQLMDAFCLLSKPGRTGEMEGFGIALLEASAAGTPVIAAASGGMTEVVSHGENGFVVPVDSDWKLVNAVNTLVFYPQLATQQVARARKLIREEFNWNAIAAKLLEQWQDSVVKDEAA